MSYWLVQANPRRWRIDDFFAEQPPTRLTGWSISRYRTDVQPGDEFALWRAGPSGGVVAMGVVTGTAEYAPGAADEYWDDEEKADQTRWWLPIRLTEVFIDTPISRDALRADPRFADAAIIRQPWAGNPFPLTQTEWAVIREHRSGATGPTASPTTDPPPVDGPPTIAALPLLRRLEGTTLETVTGRPNRILQIDVERQTVLVGTGRARGGRRIPIAAVQHALDVLVRDGEVVIRPLEVGYRSAFIGAVLRTVPGATVRLRPARITLSTGVSRDDDTARQLLDAIGRLRRWRRGDQRAPHKPLLLLVALDRIRRGLPRLASFPDLEDELRPLLSAFAGDRTQAAYPFWRLQADGLWEVPGADQLPARAGNTDPRVSVLRDHRALGGLPAAYDALLRRRPDVLDEAVDAVLAHFPADHHAELLAAAGWNDTTQRPPTARNERGSVQPEPLGIPVHKGDLPDRTRAVRTYQVDPDTAGRGAYYHELTRHRLIDALAARGLTPLGPVPTSPPYDLAWETPAGLFVAEVKSLTAANEERQLRLGLGQVLRYRQAVQRYRADKPVIAVLAVETDPTDSSWETLCAEFGIRLVSPSGFATLAD